MEQFNSEFDANVLPSRIYSQDVDRSHGWFWDNHVEIVFNSIDLITKHMSETFAVGRLGMYFLCNSDLGKARLSDKRGG